MHTVYRAESIVDAHLVKDYLEQADIPVFIAGEYLTGGVGQLPARDFLHVTVPDSYAQAAAPLVAEMVAMLSDARDAIKDEDIVNGSDMTPFMA